jgi:conjugative transfer pilus assembly protein TraH
MKIAVKKMKSRIKITVFAFVLSFSCSALAWKLGDTLKGMSVNVTKPGNFQGQASGMYSGGGMSLRNPSASFRPLSITPPRFDGGCSGIDIYWGGFEVMTKDQLVQTFKALGTKTVTYALQLGMKSYFPQGETILSDLREMAMDLSQFAIDDCQAVRSMYAAILPGNSAIGQKACEELEADGRGKDYFGAREKCQDSKKARAKVEKNFPDALIDNFNLFVYAANKSNIGKDLIESLMSFAGTLVVKDGKRSFFESLVADENSYRAQLKGGTGSQYICDNKDSCLNVRVDKNFEISEGSSYLGQANKKLEEIYAKMMANTKLSEEDIGFIDSVGESFPIYEYLSLEAVTGGRFVDRSSELLANLMLQGQLTNIVQDIKITVLSAQSAQLDESHFKDYLGRLDRVQNLVLKRSIGLPALIQSLNKRASELEKFALAKIR